MDSTCVASSLGGSNYDQTCDSFTTVPLYGRESERLVLTKALLRVKKGSHEAVFVSGPGGSGKSRLVQATFRDLVASCGGYFVEGKWDQVRTNEPYSAIVAALSDLCDLLCQSDDFVPKRKQEFQAKLGPGTEGNLISSLLPRPEIFSRVRADNLGGVGDSVTAARFIGAFQEFMAVVSSNLHPIVVFLDDFQWSGEACFDVVRSLLANSIHCPHVLYVIAYRNDEGGEHLRRIDRLTDAELTMDDSKIHHIALPSLDESAINQMVALRLDTNPAKTRELAKLVRQKTDGNAFFAREFLSSLLSRKLISFNSEAKDWEWDIRRVTEETNVTQNVVQLINQKLRKQSPETRAVLATASFLGHRFERDLLQKCVELPECKEVTHSACGSEDIGDILLRASREGLIEQTSPGSFKFSHDCIQSGVSDSITSDDNTKQRLYTAIGYLSIELGLDKDNRGVFFIADTLVRGTNTVDGNQNITGFASICLKAARLSALRSDFHASHHYSQAGVNVLETTTWADADFYNLHIKLRNVLSFALLCLGRGREAEQCAKEVIKNARSLEEKALAFEYIVLTTRAEENGQARRGVHVGVDVLRTLGFKIPSKLNILHVLVNLFKTRMLLRQNMHSHRSMMSMKEMTDDRMKCGSKVFVRTGLYAMGDGAEFLATFCFLRALQLSLKHGFCAENTPAALAMYCVTEAMLGNVDTAVKYGKFTLGLLSKLETTAGRGVALCFVHICTLHWKIPIWQLNKPLNEAYEAAMIHDGDIELGVFSLANYIASMYRSGSGLVDLMTEMRTQRRRIIREYDDQEIRLFWIYPYMQTVLNLCGETEDPVLLSGEVMEEEAFEQNVAENNWQRVILFMMKLELAYLFDSVVLMELALDKLSTCNLKQTLDAHFNGIFLRFFTGMASLKLWKKDKETKHMATFRHMMRQLKTIGTMNTKPLYLCMYADYLSTTRKTTSEEELVEAFENAIVAAKDQGFTQLEALANELASYAIMSSDLKQTYTERAIEKYHIWGAVAKVHHVERKVLIARGTTAPSGGPMGLPNFVVEVAN